MGTSVYYQVQKGRRNPSLELGSLFQNRHGSEGDRINKHRTDLSGSRSEWKKARLEYSAFTPLQTRSPPQRSCNVMPISIWNTGIV
eukprot:1295723-Pyramimonas_sp.AAC.1